MAADPYPLELRALELFVFLDGVVTDTASVHAAAWKRTFDAFQQLSGRPFSPFDNARDYPRYVDGKPRADGVRDFLDACGAALPQGDAADPPERETVYGLGNLKDKFFRSPVASRTKVVFLLEDARAVFRPRAQPLDQGDRGAVDPHAVRLNFFPRLANLFDLQLDGLWAEQLGLPGKPAPDTFLEAARRLEVPPARAAAVEDAVAGVEAGAAGGFALVVGVARKGDAADLGAAGASVVVRDLAELTFGGDQRLGSYGATCRALARPR